MCKKQTNANDSSFRAIIWCAPCSSMGIYAFCSWRVTSLGLTDIHSVGSGKWRIDTWIGKESGDANWIVLEGGPMETMNYAGSNFTIMKLCWPRCHCRAIMAQVEWIESCGPWARAPGNPDSGPSHPKNNNLGACTWVLSHMKAFLDNAFPRFSFCGSLWLRLSTPAGHCYVMNLRVI